MSDTSTQLDGSLPLHSGSLGAAVADLQYRLTALGISIDDVAGIFGDATTAAVASFQVDHDLPASGVCDESTWSAVVEAGFRLGSRLLHRQNPMLRGEDVAELQHRLSQLGFDTGPIDGIFGDQTGAALVEFQRNMGLHPDGVLGRRALAELDRLGTPAGEANLVSRVRERLAVVDGGDASGLKGRRIAVSEPGGFSSGSAALCRVLRDAGAAAAVAFTHRDPSRCAEAANKAGVNCLIALRLVPDSSSCRSIFYRGFHYESPASRHLAELIQAGVPAALGLNDGGVAGMAAPILRETRMPAVEIQLGSPEIVVTRTAELAAEVVVALEQWVGADWG